MFVQWLRKYGVVVTTSLVTVLVVLASVGLTAILDNLLKGTITGADLLIGTVVPILLVPPLAATLLHLTYQLDCAETTLRELSQRDPLTGLHNRRYLFEQAQTELARSRRYGAPLSVLMLDLDHFKHINDTYGHKAGDQVLRDAAAVCVEVLRKTDIIARYGGEEFAIVLPETGLIDAVALGQRLRSRIELMEVPVGSTPLRVTVSIGVSTVHAQDSGIEAAMVRADEALYAAKQGGRNQVRASEVL